MQCKPTGRGITKKKSDGPGTLLRHKSWISTMFNHPKCLLMYRYLVPHSFERNFINYCQTIYSLQTIRSDRRIQNMCRITERQNKMSDIYKRIQGGNSDFNRLKHVFILLFGRSILSRWYTSLTRTRHGGKSHFHSSTCALADHSSMEYITSHMCVF